MKDFVLLAVSFYLLKQDLLRLSLAPYRETVSSATKAKYLLGQTERSRKGLSDTNPISNERDIDMKKLAGRVAIVTGASKGIGAAVAKALAAEGAAVAVIYSSGKEGAERLVSQITREGGKASAIQADVSKAADVKRMFEKTKKSSGSVECAREQCRRLSIRTLRSDHGKRVPSRIRHQCARDDSRDAGSAEIFPVQRRQHYQYQFHRQRESGAEFMSLLRNQGRH